MQGRKSDWQARRLDFDETRESGKFLRRDFPPANIAGQADFVRGRDANEFEQLLRRASSGDQCLELAFFDSNDSFLRELRQMAGPTLNTFEVEGYLEYRGLRAQGPTSIPITGVGVVRRDAKVTCR